jgi:hypothetical protein
MISLPAIFSVIVTGFLYNTSAGILPRDAGRRLSMDFFAIDISQLMV